MPHAPRDPKVREAYQDMIRQTTDQYNALVDAGYEFTFFDSSSDPYAGNPWSAMRDLRANKRMAVYGTYDGFGTEGLTAGAVDDNPLLADTGLRWKDQAGQEHAVVANDLFRAVHDAFGHGLEGAGFRAQGEENAWQAHVRLFTGPAVGALTTETRGQNSWLNFGPYGERNRTAKIEDTVFAEQKTGLMPEWTWTEGRAEDITSEKRVHFSDKTERPTLNIGMSTREVAGGGELNEASVRKAIEDLGVLIDAFVVHSSDSEPTAVVTIDRPLTAAEGDSLSVQLQQEAIVQRMPDGTGDLFGPQKDNWGPYNPEFFMMPDGSRAAEASEPVVASARREQSMARKDSEAIIALRKQQSVLRSILTCLGS